MKLFKIALVVLVLVMNLLIAQPSWADPDLTKTPAYTEVTQALDNLLNATDSSGLSPEDTQKQIGELKLQKYILESAKDWAQCSNKTGKTLAVYAHKPKKSPESTLFFLGNGQSTDDDWNCDGVYLPTGTQIAGLTSDAGLSEPIAYRVLEGTRFVAKTNPTTGAIEFNTSPTKVFKTGEPGWTIPDLAQADIEAHPATAPIDD
jgi:hypothetical protein